MGSRVSWFFCGWGVWVVGVLCVVTLRSTDGRKLARR